MNDDDITNLAAKLTQSLATKDDLMRLEEKVDTILKFAEAIDETTTNHENRLKKIEAIPAVAHDINK